MKNSAKIEREPMQTAAFQQAENVNRGLGSVSGAGIIQPGNAPAPGRIDLWIGSIRELHEHAARQSERVRWISEQLLGEFPRCDTAPCSRSDMGGKVGDLENALLTFQATLNETDAWIEKMEALA